MTYQAPAPYAVFLGALGDTASGGWYAAQAVVEQGFVTLWIAESNGWVRRFTAPAAQIVVKSAAQRITLVVAGQSYPILADPGAVNRALRLNVTGIVANVLDRPGMGVASDIGRSANQIAAARSFQAGGGEAFLAAMRASGARVSRIGFGALFAIGCGTGLFVAIAVTVITVLVLNTR